MKNLKAFLIAGSLVVASSAMAEDYNRVGISYDNNHYGFNKEFYGNDKEENPSCSTNGFGLNYTHGFGLSKTLPMFLEVGGSVNFGFYNDNGTILDYGDKIEYKEQFQNINLTVPVSFAWKFGITDNFYITPYTGINFKLNFLTQERVGATNDGKTVWSDWVNMLKEEKDKEYGLDKDEVWNVFQMGWHIGATFGWKQFSLGLQYGIDFIPAYSHTYSLAGFNETYKVNTTNFKLTLGYNF
ncbi:MAG: hypothetical protein HDS18_01590 [Bacteroides sp.]|nr:hypothetical protein [Bacteroides sp.]